MLGNLLKVEDLKLALHTPRGVAKVLDGVNFHIDKSEIFGLVGETGCGKTVTSLSIIGLLPKNAITSGRIFLDGEDLLKKSDSEMQNIRGKKVSMVLQDPMSSLNPVFSIGEQICDVIEMHHNATKEEVKTMAIDMFKSVELPEPQTCFKLYPHELSGGMLQRAAIAIALCSKPMLVIADEPTSALDVTIQKQILELFTKLKTDLGISVLLITHDLGVVAEVCDRVSVMYAGNVVEEASTSDLFKNPLHPYTKGLLGCVPDPSKREKGLLYIEGFVPDMVDPPNGCRFHPRCEKAMPLCRREKPRIVKFGNDHMVACHLAV
jgi:oligopeptide/dipeptide ABC transporter ATP-binding protein